MSKSPNHRPFPEATRPVHMIATVGRRGQIGLAGTVPWQNSADLGWLRETTVGSVVIVGRRTLETMPTLIGRDVLPFDSSMTPLMLIEHASSRRYRRQPVFIAGGAYVYRVFSPFVNGLRLINHVTYDGDADAWFPFDAYDIPQTSEFKNTNREI